MSGEQNGKGESLRQVAESLGKVAEGLVVLSAQLVPPKRLRVLLVDDDPAILRALRRALAGKADVWVTTDPVHAQQLLKVNPVDAVVTDLDLGSEWDGVWLLQQLPEHHPRARRVLTSGQTPDNLSILRRSGVVQAFLPKPVVSEDLLAALGVE